MEWIDPEQPSTSRMQKAVKERKSSVSSSANDDNGDYDEQPQKKNVPVWCKNLCDCKNGYVLDFVVYTGITTEISYGMGVSENTLQTLLEFWTHYLCQLVYKPYLVFVAISKV